MQVAGFSLIIILGLILLSSEKSFIYGIILIGAGGFLIFRASKKATEQIESHLAKTNQLHGTQFTYEGGFGYNPRIFFDQKARKILIVSGKDSRIEDFSFIRSWNLKWVTVSNNSSISYRQIRIEFDTSDYQSPLMKFSCSSKQEGDTWNSRLGIIFS